MFGGVQRVVEGTHRIRRDINVLLLGDPGIGKSQLLKFANDVFPISKFASGTNTTVAGLTASVLKDSGDITLQAGAVVLADGGVC